MRGLLVHIIDSLGAGGAEILLCNTIHLLKEYRHIIVTLHGPEDLLDRVKDRLEAYYCLHYHSKMNLGAASLKLRRIILKHRPLLVHAHLQMAGLLAKFASPRSVPLFYTLHSPYSLDAFSGNRLALWLERMTSRRPHHLIAISQRVLTDYQQHVGGRRTEDVVYNMVNAEFFEKQPLEPYKAGAPLRCVAVGNLNRAKNYPFLLRTFARLKDLPVSLDVYGGWGQDTSPEQLYPEQADAPHVRFMGKSTDISEVLPHYHLFLAASIYEGFGIAPLEAMASGLPVFASNIRTFQEVGNGAVAYFELSDDESLEHLLRDAVSGKVSLPSLAEAGRERAEEIAHPDLYKNSLLNVYNKYL